MVAWLSTDCENWAELCRGQVVGCVASSVLELSQGVSPHRNADIASYMSLPLSFGNQVLAVRDCVVPHRWCEWFDGAKSLSAIILPLVIPLPSSPHQGLQALAMDFAIALHVLGVEPGQKWPIH